jgi:hypothetical protein
MDKRNVTNGHVGPGSFHTAPASTATNIINALKISKKRRKNLIKLVEKLQREGRIKMGVK